MSIGQCSPIYSAPLLQYWGPLTPAILGPSLSQQDETIPLDKYVDWEEEVGKGRRQ